MQKQNMQKLQDISALRIWFEKKKQSKELTDKFVDDVETSIDDIPPETRVQLVEVEPEIMPALYEYLKFEKNEKKTEKKNEKKTEKTTKPQLISFSSKVLFEDLRNYFFPGVTDEVLESEYRTYYSDAPTDTEEEKFKKSIAREMFIDNALPDLDYQSADMLQIVRSLSLKQHKKLISMNNILISAAHKLRPRKEMRDTNNEDSAYDTTDEDTSDVTDDDAQNKTKDTNEYRNKAAKDDEDDNDLDIDSLLSRLSVLLSKKDKSAAENAKKLIENYKNPGKNKLFDANTKKRYKKRTIEFFTVTRDDGSTEKKFFYWLNWKNLKKRIYVTEQTAIRKYFVGFSADGTIFQAYPE